MERDTRHLASRIASAAVKPQTQLKNRTSSGVNTPSSSPAIPLLALNGNTMNSCTIVGNRLNTLPLKNTFDFNMGRTNNTPQMPPQTILG